MPNLNDYIKFNSEFRSSVNLYLSLNKEDKINSFIPTKSSAKILNTYLDAVAENHRQATLLLGPYGKGKSHLLLVLLAILSLERNAVNSSLIKSLIKKMSKVDADTAKKIEDIWKNKGRFLPVLISGAQDDLSTPFLVGISDSLKKAGLDDLIPETYYGHAIDCIERWEKEYPDTYEKFEDTLGKKNCTVDSIKKSLKAYDTEALKVFRSLYSKITSGGTFNPLVNNDVLPVYRNIADQLKENHGYSGIYIIFDEFSKFIEGQNKKAAGKNMKMLQDMCELAADSKESQVFITMVAHKGIKEYGNYLSKEIINSFTGIEGRIEEVQFVTSTKNNYELIQNAIFKDEKVFSDSHVSRYLDSKAARESFNFPAFKSTFNVKDFEKIVLKGCFPLTPVSAYLLLNVSEKVAQNERTLFTFISKEEQGSMATYVKNHEADMPWFVCPDMVYDYFRTLFKKSIANDFVHNEWLNADYALAQTNDVNERRIIKTLALINIVNKPSELPSNENTLVLASGVESVKDSIKSLENKSIIYKRSTDNTYVFKTRATSDAKNEISKRRGIRSGNANYSTIFSEIAETKYVLPRIYNYKYKMTRFFEKEYMEVEAFLGIQDEAAFFKKAKAEDGKIIYLYKMSDNDYLSDVENKIQELHSGRLVIVYSTMQCDIDDALCEYDAVSDLKADKNFFAKDENKVLLNELPLIENELSIIILKYMSKAFSDEANPWIFRYTCKKVIKSNDMKLVDVVDDVTAEVFDKAIVVNNELINKKMISTAPIKKARLNIIEAILGDDVVKIDGYMNGTSADSTIYRALFVNNGINNASMRDNEKLFIDEIDEFISSCGDERKCLADLISKLTSAPFGVRAGVIPIYIAYCISKRKDDVIAYFSEKEITITPDVIVSMCESPDDFSLYISLDSAAKEEYLQKLSELFHVDDPKKSQDSRITVIYAAMQKWFRGLPQVTKNIRKQDEYFGDAKVSENFVLLKKIMQAVDGNPYEALFTVIPDAMKEKDLLKVYEKLSILYEKLNKYYDYLCCEIIRVTKEVIGGEDKELYHLLKNWYEKQSDSARNGLYSNTINEFMRLAAGSRKSDEDIAEKLSKIVIGVYFDSWNDASLEQYKERLATLITEIEDIRVDSNGRRQTLIFTSKSGNKIEQKYDLVDENTGAILRNIISDALDDFSDLQVNDKVAILLEMVEKALGQEN